MQVQRLCGNERDQFPAQRKQSASKLRTVLGYIASIHPNQSHTLLRDLLHRGISGKWQDLVAARTYPRQHRSDPQAKLRRLNSRGQKGLPHS